MAKIISISTAVPQYKHRQDDILHFMERAYGIGDNDKRKLRYLYKQGGIDTRYSVIPDYTLPMNDWQFFPHDEMLEPFPTLNERMERFQKEALPLSLKAAEECVNGKIDKSELTHIITVSCTGMSAPGLEMQLTEAMGLPISINRVGINFMGCYAAIHALKQANDIITADKKAKVLIVCTELCTLHFQKTFADEFISAPLLFADGSAAVLVVNDEDRNRGIKLDSFYSEVLQQGKNSMLWNLSNTGFVMTLAADVPDLFREHIAGFRDRALSKAVKENDFIKYWCIHPGGKRILEVIADSLKLDKDDLCPSYEVLRDYGNMSSPTVLFVLKNMWDRVLQDKGAGIFGAAFGPGLTIESMTMSVV